MSVTPAQREQKTCYLVGSTKPSERDMSILHSRAPRRASTAKAAVYLSLSGLLVLASACAGPRKPRLDGSVDPIMRDAAVSGPCEFGNSDSGACRGATELDVDFCDRAWIEATPASGLLGQDVMIRARAKDPERNGLKAMWMADPDGTFADAGAVTTTYHCDSLGRKMLSMTAVDDRGCDSVGAVEINCITVPVPTTTPTAPKVDAGTP
ncbi:MAG: hypothetical protein RLZZ450_799 [Pseudomonadota bacterium]|jgi:hypothetical protein